MAYVREHRNEFLSELMDFLRIPSISALPEYAPEVQRAAEWVVDRMTAAGIENAKVMPTGGHPVVYGDWLHAPGKATIMIYGHFDTQPADPIDLWSRPPFEPVVVGDRIYARGASDDKGNMLIPILAAEAMLKGEGALPVNVKFLFEGQEEIGSPQLTDFVRAHKELLACDVVFSSDGGQYSEAEGAVLVGRKGLCGVQIEVQGAKSDVHSGTYGGAIQNPIHALALILNSMRSPDGKITIDGFYDNVVPLTAEDRASMAMVPFDEEKFKRELGIDDVFGEPGYTTLERAWARPTLDVNGIWGGFQGEGTKTVLPCKASAKLTCRLVPDQDPNQIMDLIEAHVARFTPAGVKVAVKRFPGTAKPYHIPRNHPGNEAARAVLEDVYGKPPYYIRTGGTIAVCHTFLSILGVHTVSFAFGLNDECVHAPNEFFRLSSWDRGQAAYCKLFIRMGQDE
jgi:acetylornithine deacetylase/succinyl-diaminopimelate desuccinylase-like protein